ncbi:3-oxoacyl-ACP reductase FabG [Arthrobacter sp. B2a2-09]|uniref:3-oxoacyl-ACP reductase FabG n=1 Tax=Arthrobacter sp. B2a2-09 TaxID=2952822 RepID=UPI0022CD850C|nr:3-oxoacyl-ACP reductase FabG [Arthrobacter sp. B2a2-09]MCZ9882291.1 3-oxoacyl-ACP reductase FabG [Arthrobacter sp. B2a2-09]
MFSLKDQVAVVTGAASGIGRGIAEVLHGAGAQVVIADIDVERGRATADELGAVFSQVDVTSRNACEEMVTGIVDRFGRLDVMCSNTGIFPQAALDTMTDEQWDRTLEVNLKGTFLIVQAALRPMRKQKYGRIVITSSITGSVTGFPGWSHYGASKAGQQGFMRSAALECARDGVTINAVLPGNVLTDGLKAQGDTYLRNMAAGVPMNALGQPRDIGHAACFLASPEARYITGQTLIVDGGQILPESVEALA